MRRKDQRRAFRRGPRSKDSRLWLVRSASGVDVWYIGKSGRWTGSSKEARKWDSRVDAVKHARQMGDDWCVVSLDEISESDDYV